MEAISGEILFSVFLYETFYSRCVGHTEWLPDYLIDHLASHLDLTSIPLILTWSIIANPYKVQIP